MTELVQSEEEGEGDFLTYAERKRLARDGTLSPLVFDEVPERMVPALRKLFSPNPPLREWTPGVRLDLLVGSTAFARTCLLRYGSQSVEQALDLVIHDVDELLSYLELAYRDLASASEGRTDRMTAAVLLEEALNELFRMHRFGYEMRNGTIFEISSPALVREVLGPALLVAAAPGWHQVEEAYHAALVAFREDLLKPALTQAVGAVEAALKAAGVSGGTLKELLHHAKGAPWLVGNDAGTLLKVCDLIERMLTWRKDGDAHGAAPDADPASRARAALAIHWAGAVIVYVHECWAVHA